MTGEAFGKGLLFSLPLIAFAVAATSSWGIKQRGLKKIYRIIKESFLGDFIKKSGVFVLFAVALSAGVGEEILFREGI